MRALKVCGIVLGAIVSAIVLLLLAVWLLVNPNDYKGRIERVVKGSTGRELALPGAIKLSVFPWISLELGPASLGNPPGFGDQPFAAVQHASVRVKLLPLLRKELEIGRVEIDGLDLRLVRDAQGKGNWEGFGGRGSATPRANTSRPTSLPELAGVVIRNSRVGYQDLVVEHVNLEIGELSAARPVPLKLALDLIPHPAAAPLTLAGRLELTLDPERKQYQVSNLQFDGTLVPKAGAAPVSWKFSAPQLSLDLGAQTLSAENFNAQLGSARFAGAIQGTKVVDAPSLTGRFKLDPVGLRELMGQLGMAAPQTRDPKVLAKLAASGEFAYGGNAARATKLDMQLDDSGLRGSLGVTNLDTKAMTFDLALDRINLDRYMSPVKAAPKAETKATATPTALPADALKGLDVNGTATIGSAQITGVTLTQVRVGVDIKENVMHLAPLQAQLYGGTYSGDITLDERGKIPVLRLEQRMNGIGIEPLLKDFAKTQRLSGRGNVTTHLTAEGATSNSLMKSLSGHVAADLTNGAVEGVDLWFEINRALSLIQKQTLPAGTSSGRTKFDTFKASADLNNGVASTRDLTIASQNLRVTGLGTSNLVTEAVDYQLKASLLKGTVGTGLVGGKSLVDIPLTITGTMTSPKVRPDLESVAKARVQQQLQQTLQDKLKSLIH
jgi:AsmA protein